MIHIVTASNRHHYRAQLTEMHQLRRVHFIEERGWSDLKVVDGGEYDEYDDDRAVYLIALGPDAEVLGSARVRPTDDKCMLADVFPDLLGPDVPVPKGRDIWEISRAFSSYSARRSNQPKQDRVGPGEVIMDVTLAAMEWVNQASASRMVATIDLALYAATCESGWNVRMTGLPMVTHDGPIIGIEMAVTTADIEGFRRLNRRPARAGYLVTEADMAVFGSLAKIQAEFEEARADGRMMPGEAVRAFGGDAG